MSTRQKATFTDGTCMKVQRLQPGINLVPGFRLQKRSQSAKCYNADEKKKE